MKPENGLVKACKHIAEKTNIAVMVIILCFSFLALVYLKPPTDEIDLSFGQIFKEFIGLIGLCVGYLFGHKSK